MTEQRTTAGPDNTDDQHLAKPADNSTDHLTAAATVERSRHTRWPVTGRLRRRDRTTAGEWPTPSPDDTRNRADADTGNPEAGEPIDPQTTDTAPDTRKSTSSLVRAVSFGVVPVLAIVSALGVAYLRYADSIAATAEQARVESLAAAKDSTVAMLSYTPGTADKDLSAARDRLTGTFRDSYSSLIRDVVIPGAKQQKVSAAATVPAAASMSADRNHAVVLVYVNQAITVGNDAPTQSNSVAQVTLERSGNLWLVSGFDPK